MSTWLVALAGGAVGSLLTAALAVGGRLLATRREIEATDRSSLTATKTSPRGSLIAAWRLSASSPKRPRS